MPPTIVVPLDGSGNAEQALPYARALAGRTGGALLLVTVVDLPVEFGAWSAASSGAFGAEVERWIAESEFYLKRVTDSVDGLAVGTTVRLGAAATEIRDIVQTVDEPLVVMTSHGRSGVARLFLGSVASKLVQDAGCPVVVIRIREQVSTAPPSLDEVLVPLDGSEFSEAGLEQALAILGDGLSLHLLRVVEIPAISAASVQDGVTGMDYGLIEEYLDVTRADARTYLATLSDRLTALGHTVTVEVRDGQVAAEILKAAVERRAGLVAMATHGRGGLSRLVFGSVAERVLHDADRPLLLTRRVSQKP